jgi:hypothetical protein
MFAANADSDRAKSIEDYQNTCTEFIVNISKDYKDWVDRYDLGDEENKLRKHRIDNIVKTTSEWIFKYGANIKKIDIIMNDGINKMAENTAGYPFKFEVFVNHMSRYIIHPVGEIKLKIDVIPRHNRRARIGQYQKDKLFLINSNSSVNFAVSQESLKGIDILMDYIVIDAKKCQQCDLISITVIVEEVDCDGDHVTESRGYSTLILVS